MRIGTPARLAPLFLLFAAAAPLAAQPGAGEGFLFRPPPGAITVYGGLAAPFASGGVHGLATSELTVDKSDFRSGSWGADLAFSLRPRWDLVLGFEHSSTINPSEYRDWVDNNDLPIEQVTRFSRMPVMANLRYYLADRGRRVGSVAWIPAQFVPFISVGAGAIKYRFEQEGDFVDEQTLNIFGAQLTSKGWTTAFQAGAGAQWNLNQNFMLTGELRYLHARGDGDSPGGEFAGYSVNLSGVGTLIGLSLRF